MASAINPPLETVAQACDVAAAAITDVCYFFTIPPELRNEIYEISYAAQPTGIDFVHATPPSKSLILASRRIYNEANGIYRTAYKRFWAENTFTIAEEDLAAENYLSGGVYDGMPRFFPSAVKERKDEDIAAITRFRSRFQHPSYGQSCYELSDGAWNVVGKSHKYSFVVPPLDVSADIDVLQTARDIDEDMEYFPLRPPRRAIILSRRPWSRETKWRAVRFSNRVVLTKDELRVVLARYW